MARRLKNGELLASPAASQILHTNFYSYGQPEVEFANHHWLAGVIFYAVHKVGGLAGSPVSGNFHRTQPSRLATSEPRELICSPTRPY